MGSEKALINPHPKVNITRENIHVDRIVTCISLARNIFLSGIGQIRCRDKSFAEYRALVAEMIAEKVVTEKRASRESEIKFFSSAGVNTSAFLSFRKKDRLTSDIPIKIREINRIPKVDRFQKRSENSLFISFLNPR